MHELETKWVHININIALIVFLNGISGENTKMIQMHLTIIDGSSHFHLISLSKIGRETSVVL